MRYYRDSSAMTLFNVPAVYITLASSLCVGFNICRAVCLCELPFIVRSDAERHY